MPDGGDPKTAIMRGSLAIVIGYAAPTVGEISKGYK